MSMSTSTSVAPLAQLRSQWPAPDLGGIDAPWPVSRPLPVDSGPLAAAAAGLAIHAAGRLERAVDLTPMLRVGEAFRELARGITLRAEENERALAATRAAGLRAREEAGRTTLAQARMSTPTPAQVARPVVSAADIILGARSEASYLMTTWNGAGELSRRALVTALLELETQHGVSVKPPVAKSAHAHLGRAIQLLSSRGFAVRAERGRGRKDRNMRAAWVVGVGNTRGMVGDNFGRIVLRVSLTTSDAVEMSYEDEYRALADDVSTEYRRTADAEAYPPGDVTQWANEVIRGQFRGVRLGSTWIIPSEHAADAERFCEALANRCMWGRDWMLPGIPVSSTRQLMVGMARGLSEEARAVLADLATQRKAARDAGRSDVGSRSATTLLARLTTVSERARSYAVALGQDLVNEVQAEIDAAIALIRPLLDDTSQRGAMLELD